MLCAGLLAVAGASAAAQDDVGSSGDHGARMAVISGVTGGGDSLAVVPYTNGAQGTVTAGGLFQAGLGIDYRVNDAFSLQASVSRHISDESSVNGGARFSRLPLELIAYANVSPSWRVGVGARYASRAKLRLSNGGADRDFDSTPGGLVEVEYLMEGALGIKLRYVVERFDEKLGTGRIEGRHAGAFLNYYF